MYGGAYTLGMTKWVNLTKGQQAYARRLHDRAIAAGMELSVTQIGGDLTAAEKQIAAAEKARQEAGRKRTVTITREQMLAIGGNPWDGYDGRHRIYLDGWAEMIGLEVCRYNTGNISAAWLRGEEISNGKATRMLTGKVFWEKGNLIVEMHPEFGYLASWVRVAIANAIATTESPAALVARLRNGGRSAREIAKVAGVHVSTVYRWARGAFAPSADHLAALTALVAA